VGQKENNGLLKRTILNIPNFLLITGGRYWENPPIIVDDSITDEFLTI
jgi:hypothetical protein